MGGRVMGLGSAYTSRWWIAAAGVFWLCLCGAAHATLYVYQMPGGTRIITDHALGNPDYRLIRMSDAVRGIGALMSQRQIQSAVIDPSAYDRLIRHAAAVEHVDVALVKAVMHVESGFDPHAVSPKGASGLMQLMPDTAEHYGVRDIFDPAQNVRAGVHYLKDLLVKFNYNHRLALAAYNAGENVVRHYNGVPPFDETQSYVRRVMRYTSQYAKTERATRRRVVRRRVVVAHMRRPAETAGGVGMPVADVRMASPAAAPNPL